jgi:hypothetical protein
MPRYDAPRLTAELLAAGVPITGCASDGRIGFRPEATAADRARAEAILAAHDPTPLPPAPSLESRVAALERELSTLKAKVLP